MGCNLHILCVIPTGYGRTRCCFRGLQTIQRINAGTQEGVVCLPYASSLAGESRSTSIDDSKLIGCTLPTRLWPNRGGGEGRDQTTVYMRQPACGGILMRGSSLPLRVARGVRRPTQGLEWGMPPAYSRWNWESSGRQGSRGDFVVARSAL